MTNLKINNKLLFISLLFFVIMSKESKAQWHNGVFSLMLNTPISYQLAYDHNSMVFRNQFDINTTFLFLNAGYNYNGYFGSTMFVGIGATSIIQIQYGRNFQDKFDLIRIRSDLPLHLFTSKTLSPLRFISIGIFYDHSFNTPIRTETYGVTCSINLASFLTLKTELNSEHIYDEQNVDH